MLNESKSFFGVLTQIEDEILKTNTKKTSENPILGSYLFQRNLTISELANFRISELLYFAILIVQ